MLYRVPVLGGSPRKIISDIASTITFSPDGSRFAFMRNDENASGEDQLIVANADGTGERKVVGRANDSWLNVDGRPGWSPDGKVIACAGGGYRNGRHDFVIVVDVQRGTQTEMTAKTWSYTNDLAWLSDGSGLVLIAIDEGSNLFQLWQLSYPGGEARRITNDLSSYGGLSMTADTNSLASVRIDVSSNLWLAPGGDLNQGKQISFGKSDGILGSVWTPDGRIVYTSLASGNCDIWIMNQNGNGQKQLTSAGSSNGHPFVTLDGRYILFDSNRTGFPSIWRMDLEGGDLKQLTTGPEDYAPHVSGDGQSIIFSSWRSGKNCLWKIPFDGGDAVQLSQRFTSGADISPDGKLIAAFDRGDNPNAPTKITVMPSAGGDVLQTFDLPAANDISFALRWTGDGRALTYAAGQNIYNLWRQPIDGGPPRQLTDFKENGIGWHAWSHDGKWLLMSRGSNTSDLVLISNFR